MEDIRPTAKWANRMLRPLTAIYYRLEKHHEIVTSVLLSKAKEKEKIDATPTAEQQPTRLTSKLDQGCSHLDDEEPNDPAWIPGKLDKRKIRHNYSTRGRGNHNGPRRRSRLLIRSPEIPRTLPGAIEIATPLITGKIRGPFAELSPSSRMQPRQGHLAGASNSNSNLEQRKTGRANNSSFPPYQGSWKEVLDLSGDPGLVDIAHSLDRIFLKFLRNTRVVPKDRADGQRGARPLLSTAVRRLPDFIAEEQILQDEADRGSKVDMCDAYFTELEAFYAPGGHGWQPLREAVRAQGIYLVSRIMQNSWITPLAACRLLEECSSHKELDAFEALQTRVLASVNAYHHPTTFESTRSPGASDDPIQLLGTYYLRHPQRHSYVFDELTRLLIRGTILPEWMVTTLWKKCVDGAIKSVSTEDRNYATAKGLIEAIILSAAGIFSCGHKLRSLKRKRGRPSRVARPRETRASTTQTVGLTTGKNPCPIPIQDALSNLISSLLTALCGMCIARSQDADFSKRSAGLNAREMVHHLAFTVQRDIGDRPVSVISTDPAVHLLRRGYVLLADCTLQCGGSVTPDIIYHSDPVSKRKIEAFFRELASRQEVDRELARLVSQVFHHSGHSYDRGPSRTPREIRARVSRLARMTSTTGVAILLGRVAAEAAMELAEKSLDPDDHAWAVEIQETAASSQQDEDSSPFSSHQHSSLYRWEDSIGEWVAKTPAVKPRPITAHLAAKQPVNRKGRPRVIADSTSSSSISSICSEESNSSVTSSAPSVSRKRACASQDSSARPFKKSYHTRSVERVESKESAWADFPDRPPCEPSSEATHVPVAARTRTGLRDVLRKTAVGQGNARQGDVPLGSMSTIEVVIMNKSSQGSSQAAPSKHHIKPIKRRRRVRHSAIMPRKSPRLIRRRLSAPARVSRSRTIIPCSQDDDSDDELSFL
ncbi:hypothetical protein BJY04DRAFT_160009 [Aspergillus karnatakaensis]|uniref:uncharacterized protein n=1 Tax=Aspergillus karnatakaensis TaxID=1810916 RepID=UPI003CCDEFCA